MWERACSRMRSVSQQIHWLIRRIREQARSHKKASSHGGAGKSRTHKNARHNRAFCIDLFNERGK